MKNYRGQNMSKTVFLIAIILLSMKAGAVESLPIHGAVHEVVDGATVTWNPQNFAGFYYDIDGGIGNEQITMMITGNKLEEPNGVKYTTTVQEKKFKFERWGWYNSIGFLGEEYFAGYSYRVPKWNGDRINPELYWRSTDANTLVDGHLLRILIDDDTDRTLTFRRPLKLADGYELALRAVSPDGNRIFVELLRYGQIIDKKIITLVGEDAPIIYQTCYQTYCYRKNIGNTDKIVAIAVHFKNITTGDLNFSSLKGVTVDAIFQISDQPVDVSVDTEYDKMRISKVDAESIEMDNKDNTITLNKNKDISLMPGIYIKTADQEIIDDESPLRFCIFKNVTEPGTYEIRGAVQGVFDGAQVTWDRNTFAGFYYDIDKNLGNEQITMTITSNRLEEGSIRYTTTAQEKKFEFESWGWYNSIGFLSEEYFAGYSKKNYIWNGNKIDPELYKQSTDRNTLDNGMLLKVLMDDDTERTFTSGTPLKLADGYGLEIKSFDKKEGKLYVELLKDGRIVDTGTVSPFSTLANQTYCYRKCIGNTEDIVVLAVHFKDASIAKDSMTSKDFGAIATVNGIFQVSEQPANVSVGAQYDKMRIAEADKTTIMMDNKESINLTRDADFPLMADIHIRTANQDVIDVEKPLRFYIYRNVTI